MRTFGKSSICVGSCPASKLDTKVALSKIVISNGNIISNTAIATKFTTNGVVIFENLSPGTYVVYASQNNYNTTKAQTTLAGGDEKEISIELFINDDQGKTQTPTPSTTQDPARLKVLVLNGQAQCIAAPCEVPVANATVYIYSDGILKNTLRTDSAGVATLGEIDAVSGPSYMVVVSAQGFASASKNVSLYRGDYHTVSITITLH